MNLKFSGVGAEKKKVGILGGLILVALALYFWPSGSEPTGGSASGVSSPAVKTGPASGTATLTKPVPRTLARRGVQRGQGNFTEFHASLKPKKDAELDHSAIDPTLRLDLLEKLQNVKVEGGARSLFEYSTGPTAAAAVAKIPEPKKIIPAIYGPPAPPKESAAAKPSEPPPPPIPLKFYGYLSPAKAGVKRAFFLDGEDIIVASEGQMVKNRYKVVRIGVNSAVVEDTQFKNHQQTLPLIEEQTG